MNRQKDEFQLGALESALAKAIIGLLVSLIGTGIVSMIVLYSNVARLTEAETRTEQQLARHLDHSVDREAYEKRDAAIQRQLNDKASRDELTELRAQVKDELSDLKDMIHTINGALSASSANGRRGR